MSGSGIIKWAASPAVNFSAKPTCTQAMHSLMESNLYQHRQKPATLETYNTTVNTMATIKPNHTTGQWHNEVR